MRQIPGGHGGGHQDNLLFLLVAIIKSRDIKGLFLGVSFVSSQVSMQLVGELLRKEESSVMAACWACMG